MKKVTLWLSLFLIAAFLLASCGGGEEAAEPTAAPVEPAEPKQPPSKSPSPSGWR